MTMIPFPNHKDVTQTVVLSVIRGNSYFFLFIFLLDCISGFIKIDNKDASTKCDPSIIKLYGKTPSECIQEATQRGINSIAYSGNLNNCNLKDCTPFGYNFMFASQPAFTTYTTIYSC